MRFLWLAYLAMMPGLLPAQTPDTVRSNDSTKVPGVIQGIGKSSVAKRVLKSITRSVPVDDVEPVRSEAAFMPFEGRVIRNIVIRHIDFQQPLYDTSRSIGNFIIRAANDLHGTSRDWVIRDHLFVRKNERVNPYKLADNERFLRDQNFLLDARIYIVPLRESDSVDVVVMTRDVFSLGGKISPSASRTRFSVYDVNLGGWGQHVEFNGLVSSNRSPGFLYEMLYRKKSIGGTFIDGTFGYTQLNTGSSYGLEEEKAYFVRFDRPLVSPYTRYAGGLEISRNWSENFVRKADSLFRDYRYYINDFWVGYNIGAASNQDRSRHFVAIRAFDQHFTRLPLSLRDDEAPFYHNRTFVLGSATFFRRDFYTTRFIYGFGRTEDIPYGHNASVTMGWSRHRGIARPYFGLDLEKSFVTTHDEFYTFGVRAGGYANSGGIEDGVLLLSGQMMSRPIPRGKFLFRQYLTADYTRLFRQRSAMLLDINHEFGLQYFRADSLSGTRRFHINSETVAFTPWQFLGFRFAGFAVGEMAMIGGPSESIFARKPFFGFGGGVRTRNENLIFGTVELRFIWFPRTVEDISPFNFRISTNLRVKYSAGFVRAPSILVYN
jgi:hypothetical protein